MRRNIAVLLAILAIAASQVMGASSRPDSKVSDSGPGGTARYQKMSKSLIQEELKKLQKEFLEAQKKVSEVDKAIKQATETHEMAPESEKAEALIRLLDIKAAARGPREAFEKVKREFLAAQDAYIDSIPKE